MDGSGNNLVFRLFAIHQLGLRLMAHRPEHEEAQEGLALILGNKHLTEEEKEISFLYLSCAPDVLTSQSRHAMIEYAIDPAHGDSVAKKGSARAIVETSMWEVLKQMGGNRVPRR
ncbi:MAG: hypothetical protein WC246_00075 [Candidatus Paceibacterota bacterium]|jgi:hypothetical protein